MAPAGEVCGRDGGGGEEFVAANHFGWKEGFSCCCVCGGDGGENCVCDEDSQSGVESVGGGEQGLQFRGQMLFLLWRGREWGRRRGVETLDVGVYGGL